jgi:FtsH-binding integral membrane protein
VSALVAVAIAIAVVGALINPQWSHTGVRVCILCALAMPLIATFGGERFRAGWFAISWLFVLAFLIGLLLGPGIGNLMAVREDAIVEAMVASAVTVVATGVPGFNLPNDLTRWMYPLSAVVLAGVVSSVVLFLVGVRTYLWISAIVFTASAGLLAVNGNYIHRRIGQARPVALATGVFVTVINVFVSLLNLTSSG